jgi:hypothetical protein
MHQPCLFRVHKLSVVCALPYIKLNDFNKTYQIQCTPFHFRFNTCCHLFCRITQTYLPKSPFTCYNKMCKRQNALYKIFKKTNKCPLECIHISLSYSTTNTFRPCEDGKNKNTATIIMCQNQFTVK